MQGGDTQLHGGTVNFVNRVEHLRLREIVVHGLISGLSFSQMTAWQDVVDSIITRYVSDARDDPLVSLVRALVITGFTITACWAVLKLCFCGTRAA